jgi:molybdate transport system regulatory protein
MIKKQTNETAPVWIEGELKLAGALDSRIIGLLKTIKQTGSLNQAAKQLGLSYKGAWQILERANNSAPQILVATATGGSKGGGSSLTKAGQALLTLFSYLEQQHQLFLAQLNRSLAENPETVLLLQRLVIKTTARNQLFGRVIQIDTGVVNAEVIVQLKGGEQIVSTVETTAIAELGLKQEVEAVLLINGADLMLLTDVNKAQFSARNCLYGKVIRIQQDIINSEVIVLLPSGEMLAVKITQQSVQNLALAPNIPVWVIFKTNAPILGISTCTTEKR